MRRSPAPAVAAFDVARRQPDTPAGCGHRAARVRDHHRRRARSRGHAGRARRARLRTARAPRSFASPNARARIPRCAASIVAARPQRAEPQPRVTRHTFCAARAGAASHARSSERSTRSRASPGSAPRFFRAPAGLRNPLLAPVLHRMGLRLASWTRRGFDTVQRDPARVLAAPDATSLAAGDIVLLHDGHAARTSAGRPVVLDVLPQLLHACEQPACARSRCLRRCVPVRRAHATGTDDERDRARRLALRSIDAASAPYRRVGRFAWHFARGKLGMDPVFRYLLRHGLIRPGARVLDIGCGQGLLASLVHAACSVAAAWRVAGGLGCAAAARAHHRHRADADRDVERAQAALGDATRASCAATCGT